MPGQEGVGSPGTSCHHRAGACAGIGRRRHGGESWPTRTRRTWARASGSRGETARRSPTSCASATTAARASAPWRRRPIARTGSFTGCCRSPARRCAAGVGPTGARRRSDRYTGPVTDTSPDGWIRTDRDGAVLRITLDRPDQLNAQTPATWTALRRVAETLDDDVRVVVVRAAGRAFSAGLDRSLFSTGTEAGGTLGELAAMPEDLAQERIRGYQSAFRWLRSPGVVSVAAVQGHAIGAGAQLALACDLRILTEDAQLRLPEATLGLVPDLTGTSTLVELVGYSRAVEICLTGRAVSAAEAVATGLANVAVPRDQLDATVADLTAALLGPDPGASRETLALLRSAVRNDPMQQDAAERAAQVRRLQALARSMNRRD